MIPINQSNKENSPIGEPVRRSQGHTMLVTQALLQDVAHLVCVLLYADKKVHPFLSAKKGLLTDSSPTSHILIYSRLHAMTIDAALFPVCSLLGY